jgi:RNA polymerase sigma-70 factor (ECF subfamily)
MLKYRHTYRDDGSFTAWMYHLARRCAADYFRKSQAGPAKGSGGSTAALDGRSQK